MKQAVSKDSQTSRSGTNVYSKSGLNGTPNSGSLGSLFLPLVLVQPLVGAWLGDC